MMTHRDPGRLPSNKHSVSSMRFRRGPLIFSRNSTDAHRELHWCFPEFLIDRITSHRDPRPGSSTDFQPLYASSRFELVNLFIPTIIVRYPSSESLMGPFRASGSSRFYASLPDLTTYLSDYQEKKPWIGIMFNRLCWLRCAVIYHDIRPYSDNKRPYSDNIRPSSALIPLRLITKTVRLTLFGGRVHWASSSFHPSCTATDLVSEPFDYGISPQVIRRINLPNPAYRLTWLGTSAYLTWHADLRSLANRLTIYEIWRP